MGNRPWYGEETYQTGAILDSFNLREGEMLEGFHIQKGNSLEEVFGSTFRLMLLKKCTVCRYVFLLVLNDIKRY